MAQHCHSCTAPLESPEFKGPSEKYCKYCADEKGDLKPRDEVREGIAHWFQTWQGEISTDVARARADQFMKALPAWAED